jgi:hypothetical protein
MRPTVGTGDGGRRGTTDTAEGSVGLRLIVGGSVGGTAGTAVTVVAIVAVGALVVAVEPLLRGRRVEGGKILRHLRHEGSAAQDRVGSVRGREDRVDRWRFDDRWRVGV